MIPFVKWLFALLLLFVVILLWKSFRFICRLYSNCFFVKPLKILLFNWVCNQINISVLDHKQKSKIHFSSVLFFSCFFFVSWSNALPILFLVLALVSTQRKYMYIFRIFVWSRITKSANNYYYWKSFLTELSKRREWNKKRFTLHINNIQLIQT